MMELGMESLLGPEVNLRRLSLRQKADWMPAFPLLG